MIIVNRYYLLCRTGIHSRYILHGLLLIFFKIHSVILFSLNWIPRRFWHSTVVRHVKFLPDNSVTNLLTRDYLRTLRFTRISMHKNTKEITVSANRVKSHRACGTIGIELSRPAYRCDFAAGKFATRDLQKRVRYVRRASFCERLCTS